MLKPTTPHFLFCFVYFNLGNEKRRRSSGVPPAFCRWEHITKCTMAALMTSQHPKCPHQLHSSAFIFSFTVQLFYRMLPFVSILDLQIQNLCLRKLSTENMNQISETKNQSTLYQVGRAFFSEGDVAFCQDKWAPNSSVLAPHCIFYTFSGAKNQFYK